MKNTSYDQPVQGKTFDWHRIHARIDAVQKILEREWAPALDQVKSILQKRATMYAQESSTAEKKKDCIEVVEFLLAHETYGIESSCITEVVPLKELTTLPGTSKFVIGIAHVRGKILSVIDLKRFFDIPDTGLTDLNKLIILHSEDMGFGILADVILGVRKILVDDLQTSLPSFTGIRAEYLTGVTKERSIILDAEKLLRDKKLIQNDGLNT